MYYDARIAQVPAPSTEYRLELGSRFHVFSNGRWWTPDKAEAEQALRGYVDLGYEATIEEWRNGEFYRVVRTKAA